MLNLLKQRLSMRRRFKQDYIRMHRQFDIQRLDIFLFHGVMSADEHNERIANLVDRTADECDICKGSALTPEKIA